MAPSDAMATNVHLQVGEYVSDGDPILSLVSTKGFWIEANLKETDLTHLHASVRRLSSRLTPIRKPPGAPKW